MRAPSSHSSTLFSLFQIIDLRCLQLALGILTSLFAGIGYASSGGSKKVTGQTPPINASSKDEADFIQ